MAATDDDIPGMIGDLVRYGKVESVDLAAAMVTVSAGGITSPLVPWLERAGGFRTWVPPTQGEQVVLVCPEGDIAGAFVMRGLFSTSFPPPSDANIARMTMPDGSTVDYDPAAHKLILTIAAGGSVDIVGKVNITGDVTVEGSLTASTDVVGGGKSLKGHTHPANGAPPS